VEALPVMIRDILEPDVVKTEIILGRVGDVSHYSRVLVDLAICMSLVRQRRKNEKFTMSNSC
jgi:hypothetical protein